MRVGHMYVGVVCRLRICKGTSEPTHSSPGWSERAQAYIFYRCTALIQYSLARVRKAAAPHHLRGLAPAARASGEHAERVGGGGVERFHSAVAARAACVALGLGRDRVGAALHTPPAQKRCRALAAYKGARGRVLELTARNSFSLGTSVHNGTRLSSVSLVLVLLLQQRCLSDNIARPMQCRRGVASRKCATRAALPKVFSNGSTPSHEGEGQSPRQAVRIQASTRLGTQANDAVRPFAHVDL
eukprot:6190903-Pleurochrysis_carterae.AAC.2